MKIALLGLPQSGKKTLAKQGQWAAESDSRKNRTSTYT